MGSLNLNITEESRSSSNDRAASEGLVHMKAPVSNVAELHCIRVSVLSGSITEKPMLDTSVLTKFR